MMSTVIHELLRDIKKGILDLVRAKSFESLSATEFVSDIQRAYPLIFQSRRIGRKHEIGLAKELISETHLRSKSQSRYAFTDYSSVLNRCFLLSSYDDRLSEITWTRNIRIKHLSEKGRIRALNFGLGTKVDKTVDGWEVKALLRQATKLSEEALHKRGFQFEPMPPFAPQLYSAMP